MAKKKYIDIGAAIDMANGSQRAITIGNWDVLLVRVGEEYFAVRNQCSHLGEPLTGGRMIGRQLTCPFHGACFDLRNGRALAGPAVNPLTLFEVHIQDGRILVAPPAE